MGRTGAAIIAGYLAFRAWTVLMPAFALSLLGEGFAFEPAGLAPTLRWTLLVGFLSFLGALLGGRLAAALDRRSDLRACRWLAAFLFAAGLSLAVIQLNRPEPPAPEPLAELDPTARVRHTRSPDAYNFSLPILTALGVMLGGKLRRDTLEQAGSR